MIIFLKIIISFTFSQNDNYHTHIHIYIIIITVFILTQITLRSRYNDEYKFYHFSQHIDHNLELLDKIIHKFYLTNWFKALFEK